MLCITPGLNISLKKEEKHFVFTKHFLCVSTAQCTAPSVRVHLGNGNDTFQAAFLNESHL